MTYPDEEVLPMDRDKRVDEKPAEDCEVEVSFRTRSLLLFNMEPLGRYLPLRKGWCGYSTSWVDVRASVVRSEMPFD